MDIVRKRPWGKARRTAGAGAIAVALLLGLLGMLRRSSATDAPAVERGAVWTEHVRRGDLLRQVPAQGVLVPEHVQWLSAATAGRIARIAARPGAAVEPDTVIV